MVTHELDADGRPSRASWDAYGRDAGEVGEDGAKVVGVHGEGVVHLLDLNATEGAVGESSTS